MYKIPNIKDVIEIGKMFFMLQHPKKKDVKKPTPMLHYIIYKEYDGYRALCLEVSLGCFEFTVDKAHIALTENIKAYISAIYFNSKSTKQLEEDFQDTKMENFWSLYRLASYEAAMKYKIPNEVVTSRASNMVSNLIKDLKDTKQNKKEKDKTIQQLKGLMNDILKREASIQEENEVLKKQTATLQEENKQLQESLDMRQFIDNPNPVDYDKKIYSTQRKVVYH